MIELRRYAAEGKEPSSGSSFRAACMAYFGTLEAARTVAGVPLTKGRAWSPEELVRELRTRQRLGVPISPDLQRAVASMFGVSWSAATQLVVRIVKPYRSWIAETVLDALREAVRLGPDIPRRLATAASWYFGDLATARRVAGVPEARRTWSREVVIEALRAHHRGGNHAGLSSDLVAACTRYFGSVARARAAAKVPPARRTWTEATIIAELKRRWPVGPVEDPSLARACRRVFGGVPEARRAAGLTAA